MSTQLEPLITHDGIAAVFNLTSTGLQAEITHVAVGDAAYSPQASQTSLVNERERYPIAGGSRVDWNRIHVSALNDGTLLEYWVREVGFFLADGTLLAVWSDPAVPLAYKIAGVDLLLAFDLILTPLPPDSVTVNGTAPELNLHLAGELASNAAAIINLQRWCIQNRRMVLARL